MDSELTLNRTVEAQAIHWFDMEIPAGRQLPPKPARLDYVPVLLPNVPPMQVSSAGSRLNRIYFILISRPGIRPGRECGMSETGNPVNWFEIPVTDLDRAKAFYEQVSGPTWTCSTWLECGWHGFLDQRTRSGARAA